MECYLVTVCFANFAFTYERSDFKSLGARWLSHLATGIFMLLILLLLVSICIISNTVYPSLNPLMVVFSALLYLGVLLYDFWDFLRAER